MAAIPGEQAGLYEPTVESLLRIVRGGDDKTFKTRPRLGDTAGAEKDKWQGSTSWHEETFDSGGVIDRPLAPPIKHRFLGGPSASSRQKRRLLIADDSYLVRNYMRLVFAEEGYEVDVAQNGLQAFASMQSRLYDYVFLDIEMPVMNGYRCALAIRRWEQRVRRPERQVICALTSHTQPHERSLSKNVGFDHFEAKPFKRSRLLDIVAAAVDADRRESAQPPLLPGDSPTAAAREDTAP